MKIAHYLKDIRLEDGGVVRAVLDMCMYQARAGHEVTLITCDDHDVPQDWKDGRPGTPRVARIDQPRRLAWMDRKFAAQVRPLVKAADVLHLHVLWEPSQIPFARAAQEHGKPYVQSPHGMLADWSVVQKKLKKDVYYSLFARKFLDGASFVVTTAQGELDQTQKRHPRTPGVVIPLVFDLSPYRELEGPGPARQNLPLPSPEHPSLIYLSRLHYKKRPDLLIEAARPLRDRGLKFNVVIAGPSDPEYDASLKDLARRLKVDDITTFLGMVPARYKPSLFQACDLFVLPTSMENFGFVYFESLACATPLVTTKGTDTWKELIDSGGGRIVERIEGSIDELVGTLGELVQNRTRLKPMGSAGREWVLKNLDPDVIVGKYIAMYTEAIAGVGRRSTSAA
jgi:glycosyltransferase involved in cell wall biosynthesis